MTIRRLTAEDAAAFREVRLRSLREEPAAYGSSAEEEGAQDLAWFAGRVAPPERPESAMFGAFAVDGALVGILGIGREMQRKRSHVAQLYSVYVAPEHRRQGFAAALLDAALEHARRLPGLQQVQLGVSAAAADARRLYVSRGFAPFGFERHAFQVDGTYFDEEHFVLFLTEPAAASRSP